MKPIPIDQMIHHMPETYTLEKVAYYLPQTRRGLRVLKWLVRGIVMGKIDKDAITEAQLEHAWRNY